MEIDKLTDELFLQHVLERQPATAPRGKKRRVWFEIAKAINEASGRDVFTSAESAIQRFKTLTTVYENKQHAHHGELTREMRAMLKQVHGGSPVPATRSSMRAQARKKAPPTRKTATPEDEGPARKRRAEARDRKPSEAEGETARDDGGQVGASETALVSYECPTRLSTQEALDRYLGAQTERDYQSRHERELLRREIAECKRDTAVLEHQLALLQPAALGPHRPQGEAAAASEPSAQRLLLELATQQRLMLEEMATQRAESREQFATMMDVVKAALGECGRAHETRQVVNPSSV